MLLRNEARSKGISLNALISSIARRYISWEKYALEVGFIPLARETVRNVFEELDDNTIATIAKRLGATLPRQLILLMFDRIDFSTITSFLEITMSRYGMVRHDTNGEVHNFVVHHNVSKKFSKFLAEAAKSMAEDLSLHMAIHNADRDVLSISFREINGRNG